MKTFRVLLFLFLNCSFLLSAQNEAAYNFNRYEVMNGKTQLVTGAYTDDGVGVDVKGSPYLYKDWNNNSILTFENGGKYKIENLNFNILESKFVSKISKDSIFSFLSLDKVSIGNRTFININNIFYENLQSGSLKGNFIKEYSGKLKAPEVHVITNKVIAPAEYKVYNKYYLYSKGKFIEFKLKKNSILKVFNSHKNEIIKFVKSNKLDYSKEEDVARIFEFYDTL